VIRFIVSALLLGTFFQGNGLSVAEEEPLDLPYPLVYPPQALPFIDRWFSPTWEVLPSKNDLSAVIGYQTPVKSQQRRGICSVFSALGIYEALLNKAYKLPLDFSENYLAFIVSSKIQTNALSGTTAPQNFLGVRFRGLIEEHSWPYEGEDWLAFSLSAAEEDQREKTCGALTGNRKKLCFKVHRDPYQADPFVREARVVAQRYRTQSVEAVVVGNILEVKRRLLQNEPLLLELTFFYGAWNHRQMWDVGLGEPNSDLWNQGKVGIPTAADMTASRLKPAGHSIVIVGYDDEKRIYQFKNSWGTEGFGQESDLLGPGTTPGYGTIPYDYAHAHGTFYRVRY